MKISILIFVFILGLSACTGAKKTESIPAETVAAQSDPREVSPDPSWHADYPKKVVGGEDIIIWMYAYKIGSIKTNSPDEQSFDHYIKDMTNGLKKVVIKTKPVKQQVPLRIEIEADGRTGTFLVQVTKTDS